ncbi:MAG: hypothetical protein HKN70_13485, partial [Gammaproteobacteria bacterium]|nr:hypothetical protein [Gammaproteobacteria bacterium]
MIRTRALLLFTIFTLWACDAPQTADTISVPADVSSGAVISPASGLRLINGHGSKGPLINSTVRLFALDAAGYPLDEVAATETDARGNWALTTDVDQDLLVIISGGRYVDEADPNRAARRVIVLEDTDHLVSVLPAGESVVAVTVFSDALVEKSRRETSNGNFLQVLDINRNRFGAAFGFDVLSVLPPDPLAPAGGAEQFSYALAVGGVANAINSLAIAMQAPQPDFRHIRWISRDLVDCRLDGLGTGLRAIMPADVAANEQASVNAQILRFRNNNFARYLGRPVPSVDDFTCALIGGSVDNTAPRIIRVADLAPLAASSAAGVAVEPTLLDRAQSGFAATDDRVGELKWELGLPAQLELGQNVLTATVSDEWGNTSGAIWQITVADMEAPVLGTLDPITVAAQGDRTSISLPAPSVTDNVSEITGITITNDAPAAGFPVGATVVTWSATDEAGLVSTVTQQVRVDSVPPVPGMVPANITWSGDGIDFSVFFTDPDGTTLRYSIAGLPPASALQFDPTAGLLSGVPGAVDYALQPLTLTVFAYDGQNTVSIQTSLEISAPNTPPVFTLSPGTVTVDEDFGELTIAVMAAPVPSAEQEQTVTYSASMVSSAPAPADFSIDSASGQLTLVSTPDVHGELVLRVLADDGQSTDATWSQDISVTVASVNDAPQVVAVPMIPTLVTGSPVAVNIAAAFSDVDDDALTFAATQLPASLGLSVAGQLSGIPQPVDAVAGGLLVTVTAVDGSGATALLELVLTVLDPDTDGDGLSDYQEMLSGFDPQDSDSDGDGYADSLELLVNFDATDQVLFVREDGDDSATGTTPETALATLDGLTRRITTVAVRGQRVIGLIEAANSPYTGNLSIGPTESEHVIIGSVTVNDGVVALHSGEVPQTTLKADSRRIVQMQGCQSCTLHHLRFEDSAGALSAINSNVFLGQVH